MVGSVSVLTISSTLNGEQHGEHLSSRMSEVAATAPGQATAPAFCM